MRKIMSLVLCTALVISGGCASGAGRSTRASDEAAQRDEHHSTERDRDNGAGKAVKLVLITAAMTAAVIGIKLLDIESNDD